ncbi:hypothetical protein Tco_0945323, partial [Tanacetum coccineum]
LWRGAGVVIIRTFYRWGARPEVLLSTYVICRWGARPELLWSNVIVCEGLVSMYLMKRDCHCAYLPVASIGGRSLEPAAIMSLRIWLLLFDVVIGVFMMNDSCVMNDVIVVKNNL